MPAVDALDLHIENGEFVVLVGPSGSGKTTALRMLAGLEEVDAGAIYIGDRDVTDLVPKKRDVAMVFQNYALYPYLTVEANIGFPLRIARVHKEERARRVQDAAKLLGLEEYLQRKPGQLSGGQRQRVAMGRAIVRQPAVFLMDEPLSNLDAKLRVQMRADIAALQDRLGVTTVYVTHDQAEAMTLGDRVVVMSDGRLQQCGPPRELYLAPVNTFVAGFIGSPAMNLLTVQAEGGILTLGGEAVPVPAGVAANGRAELVLGLRPEAFELAPAGISAEVELVEEIGADAYVFCVTDIGGETTKLVARADSRSAPKRGERVNLKPRPEEAHFFDPDSGERIGVA
jgi:multiple sugar transport system ATP-binding protein